MADSLAGLAAAWEVAAILPATDLTMEAILRRSALFARTVLVGPKAASYEAVTDKVALHDLATSLGVLVPSTSVAQNPSELRSVVDRVGYPCVVKPRKSVVDSDGVPEAVSVKHVSDQSEVAVVADCWPSSAFPVLVQERISGPGEGLFALSEGGRLLVSFAHRRLREYPLSGGASTYRESIAPSGEMLESARKLLESVGWDGLAMVEFKRSLSNGRSYLLEVNGRLWGSLQLAIDAGVDFPVMAVRLAMSEPVEPVFEYRVGIRCRWIWGDVDRLLDAIRSSSDPNPGRFRRRARELLDFAVHRPGRDHLETLRLSDARPFGRETSDWLRAKANRLGERWRRRRRSRQA